MHAPRTVRVTVVIISVIASGVAALVLLTDLPLFLILGIWIGPLVVVLPYAYPEPGKRPHGPWTVAAALALPTVTAAWIVWLVLAHGVIGRHP